MGSISDKLNYLNETKSRIKNFLNNEGIPVSDNDTFRSYVDKLQQLKPKLGVKEVTENGTYIASEDGLDGYSEFVVNVAGGGGSAESGEEYPTVLTINNTTSSDINTSITIHKSDDIPTNVYVNNNLIQTLTTPNASNNSGSSVNITIPVGGSQIKIEGGKHCLISYALNSTTNNQYLIDFIFGSNYLSVINAYTFANCKNLIFNSIPDKIKYIGQYAFKDTIGYTNSVNNNENYMIPIKNTNKKAFIKSKEDVVTVSATDLENVTLLGGAVFENCKNLTSVVLPNGITIIPDFAFRNCSELSSINIPESVTTIKTEAFKGCNKITSFIVPRNVTSISSSAFDYGNFVSLSVETENLVYDSRDNSNTIIETSTNKLIRGISTSFIPSSVKSIDTSAFSKSTALTSIDIPSGVNSIGNLAFSSCTGLTVANIYTEESTHKITSSSQAWFWSCSSNLKIHAPSSLDSTKAKTAYGNYWNQRTLMASFTVYYDL